MNCRIYSPQEKERVRETRREKKLTSSTEMLSQRERERERDGAKERERNVPGEDAFSGELHLRPGPEGRDTSVREEHGPLREVRSGYRVHAGTLGHLNHTYRTGCFFHSVNQAQGIGGQHPWAPQPHLQNKVFLSFCEPGTGYRWAVPQPHLQNKVLLSFCEPGTGYRWAVPQPHLQNKVILSFCEPGTEYRWAAPLGTSATFDAGRLGSGFFSSEVWDS